MTMREHSDKPVQQIKYAYHRRHALQHGPLADDRRLPDGHGRAHLRAEDRCGRPTSTSAIARDLEKKYGAKLTITDDPKAAVKGVDFIHTDVWVSMGEPKEVWKERIELLMPYQVNAELMKASGNPHVKFMHCLPAFHDTETDARQADRRDLRHHQRPRGDQRRVRVGGERRLRAGREPHAHDQGDPGRDAGRLRPCASSSPSAAMPCCKRGEPMTAENQRAQRPHRRARRWRRSRASTSSSISHGNGPQVGLLALQGAAYKHGRDLSARRARRADRGHDRLHDRAGARQPAAVRACRSRRC